MNDSGQDHPNAQPRWEAFAWFAAALLVYALLARDVFYKTDGPDLVRLLHDRESHPWHLAYLPLLAAFRAVLESCGVEPGYVRLGGWFSALGAAAGVGFARAGLRVLGVDASAARMATALVALCPGILLFATVVELHAPLFGGFGLAFWWTARQVRRPSWAGMAGLGVLTHGLFLLHTSGLLLPAWLLAFFVARRPGPGVARRDLGFAAVAGLVHALLFVAMPRLVPQLYGMHADLAAAIATQSATGRPQSLDYAPRIFVQEWLWPLLPVSALVWLAPRRRALRREFVAFVLGFVPMLYLSVRLLVFEPEQGAYLLPLVLPAALLAAEAAGSRLRMPLLASAAVGLLPVCLSHQPHVAAQRAFDERFAAAVAAAAASAPPLVLVGSHREMTAAFARLRPDEFLWVRAEATLPRAMTTPDRLAGVEAWLRSLHAAGRAVLATEGALASLADPAAAMRAESATVPIPDPQTLGGPVFLEHLRERFELRPAAEGIVRLVPRP